MTELTPAPGAVFCEEINERLCAYLDGELSAEEAREIERHCVSCPVCAAELAALGEIAQAAQAWEVADAPDLWPALRPSLAASDLAALVADLQTEVRSLRQEVAALRQELAGRPAPPPVRFLLPPAGRAPTPNRRFV